MLISWMSDGVYTNSPNLPFLAHALLDRSVCSAQFHGIFIRLGLLVEMRNDAHGPHEIWSYFIYLHFAEVGQLDSGSQWLSTKFKINSCAIKLTSTTDVSMSARPLRALACLASLKFLR
jgi:hypothetical protein